MWKYYNPVEVIFGAEKLSSLPSIVGNLKAVLITTPGFTRRGTTDYLRRLLGNSLVGVFDGIQPNPDFTSVKTAFDNLRPLDHDLIIALGGGSAIDTAKVVAAISAADSHYWIEEHLRNAAPFPDPFIPKPIIAIPTTAGTGSEVTMWGTIWDIEEKKKYSISHPSLYPKKTILDPGLTLVLPEKETIYSGLDAFSHSMEAIWNKNHNPVSDTLALEAISLVHAYLPELRNDPTNLDLRTYLLRASLFAGLAFSNTKTALAHSISYPLTAYFGLPHGLACALPLVPVLEFNWVHHSERVKIMAKSFGVDATIDSIKKCVIQLFKKLGISTRLRDYGISEAGVKKITESAITRGRADNNIAKVGQDDIMALLRMML